MDIGYYVGLRIKDEMRARRLNTVSLANLIYKRLGFESPTSAKDYIRSVRQGCFHLGPRYTKSMRLERLSEMLSFFNITKSDEIILKIKGEYSEFKYNSNNNHSIAKDLVD